MQLSTDNLVALAVSSISGLAFISAATFPLLISIRKQAKLVATKSALSADKATKMLYAIQNDHPKNIRNDLDEKFLTAETNLETKFIALEASVQSVHNSITKLSNKDKILTARISANKARITRQQNLINDIKSIVKDI